MGGQQSQSIDATLLVRNVLQLSPLRDSVLFYNAWKHLNPKCDIEEFRFSSVFQSHEAFYCLVKVNLLLMIEDRKCYKVRLTSKQYHDICMRK